MLDSKAKQKGLDIKYHVDKVVPEVILGDSVRLNQVMLNLVSNAIKFTEKGSITISVTCLEQNDDTILLDFSIKDTGMGIPLAKQERIFESFEQVTNDASRRFGGAGLG